MNGFPWLTVLWALPAAGAFGVFAVPRGRPAVAKAVALGVAVVTLAVAVGLAVGFDTGGARYQFVEQHQWIRSLGVGYHLGLDGIGLALVLLTAVLVPLVLLAGWHDPGDDGRRAHTYVALVLATMAMVMISFTALDVFLFYVVFEAMLVPLYFLIGGYGQDAREAGARSRAAVKFLLYNLLGGLIMLAAVIGLYVATAGEDSPFSSGTFDLPAIAQAVSSGELAISAPVANALFLGFMFAFAVKAPLWPLHTWLPDAAVYTTPTVAVLMMAVVDKVGTFAMLRFAIELFPDAARTFAPWIVGLSVVAVVYGAMLAIGQRDVMRLIAYTSISHFGFIILGIFALTSQGQSGSTLYMVNHGISTAALFLIAGFLVTRRGTRAIAAYGGIQRVAPVLAGTFLVAGMATLSLPGLAPFISEFLVLIGTYTRYGAAAIIATAALVLSAVYILWLYQRVMGGRTDEGNRHIRDLRPREIVVVAPLIVLLLVLGLYPKPILDVIDPAVESTLTSVHSSDPPPTVPGGVPAVAEGPGDGPADREGAHP
ncbi:NADH-quinone oxidoreductase subunit M [Tomitella fengzijianii]|uniref:NADH-quinone oxidoreductase subunit M n=1 Tax=Tomitella fengzijianii TaxID=2597660 RepID=A0A516X2F0_9ACTN|nr:NADH-quinone oxidoreductase subunit M [Tomitella fengzijianii]QDQ97207.1 NADH-quinone oxidoreductase subunit M [Tomitella fengzijianii]